MDISRPVSRQVSGVSFSFYSADEIRKLSVQPITNPILFDSLNHPTTHGLYDPALGPTDKDGVCATCNLLSYHCPGHFGHIELAMPCYNPINFTLLYKLLNSTCLFCHHLRMSRTQVHFLASKLRLLRAGLIIEAADLDNHVNFKWKGKASKKSSSSGAASESILDDEAREVKDEEEEEDDDDELTMEARSHQPSSSQEYLDIVDEYVRNCMASASSSSSGFTKTTLSTESIRQLEKTVLSSIPANTCANCRGPSTKYRKEGNYKVFQKGFTAKQLRSLKGKGMEYLKLNVHRSVDVEAIIKNQDPNGMDVDIDDSEEEEEDDDNDGVVGAGAGTTTNTEIDQKSRYMSAIEVQEIMASLWKNETVLLDLLFRPLSRMDDKMFEHPQNIYLTSILKNNQQIHDLHLDQTTNSADKNNKLANLLVLLQQSTNYFLDSNGAPSPGGKPPLPGIRQLLEKKEGLFRKHMMGKRVNFAARSVISPDPYIETNEIGIPPVFAVKLTYPEPVNSFNVEELRQAVIRGPKQWPGASHVQNEDGTLLNLASFDENGRVAIASQLLTPTIASGSETDGAVPNVNKKVLRHIKNGDFLLLNRQPTLHKPSIMAHTARILPGEKTIRMHYANCNTYNADFDGDEMNIHFPQNSIARAEAMLIARTDMQYLVPTDGGVLRGLIQDHVCAGVHMTSRDTMLTRKQYMQLLYVGLKPEGFSAIRGVAGSNGNIENEVTLGLGGRVLTLPPAIIKPQPLWTGKQVISTILLNLTSGLHRHGLNLRSKSKVPSKYWGKTAPEEQSVLIMDGHLLTGILDKSQFGASAHGLVHAIYEVYGPPYAAKILSIFGRLFTGFLQTIGFTCRMDDLTLTPAGDKLRRQLIDNASNLGRNVAVAYTGLKDKDSMDKSKSDKAKTDEMLRVRLEQVLRNDEKMAGLDGAMKGQTNPVTSAIISSCVPDHLNKTFPRNNMQMMTVSGAKGSAVNVSQISCLLGQQELEGRRVPTMISGKTLPSFVPFETAARAGGFITGRFLTGIKPSEYFFHCMAGREGLIDTAVKTSRSGYLQRCLIKHMEGLKVCYDQTVRDTDDSVIQFRYGEDALDVVKQKTLDKFDFCAINYYSLANRFRVPESAYGVLNESDAVKYREKQIKYAKKSARSSSKSTSSSTPASAEGYSTKLQKYSDLVMEKFNPGKYIGAVSDKFADKLDGFIKDNRENLVKSSNEDDAERRGWSGVSPAAANFKTLMHLKYQHSLAEPGEAVGLLAAQSIGEPSTQMTLNTFHFAGFGAKNVTLGIPRLREIVMTASSTIKTPLMKLTMKPGITREMAEDYSKQLDRLMFSRVVDNITVKETLIRVPGSGERARKFSIHVQLWSPVLYAKEFNISAQDIESAFKKRFIPTLERLITREIKNRVRLGDASAAAAASGDAGDKDEIGVGVKIRSSKASVTLDDGDAVANAADDGGEDVEPKSNKSGRGKNDDSDDDMDDDEMDASSSKRMKNRKQAASYDEEGENDDDEEADDYKAGGGKMSVVDQEALAAANEAEMAASKNEVIDNSAFVSDISTDPKGEWVQVELEFPAFTKKLLMLSLAEQAAKATVIREVPSINRCFVQDNEAENDKSVNLGTEGVNIRGMWEPHINSGLIDLNSLMTNDISAILRIYGVEAARNAIVNEVAGVFGVYGISVDPRHLGLIADYMTFEGGYKAFNRTGMMTNPSPFTQMSYETTTQFLTSATLTGDADMLNSPSARLVLGKVVGGGTGSFDVVYPMMT